MPAVIPQIKALIGYKAPAPPSTTPALAGRFNALQLSGLMKRSGSSRFVGAIVKGAIGLVSPVASVALSLVEKEAQERRIARQETYWRLEDQKLAAEEAALKQETQPMSIWTDLLGAGLSAVQSRQTQIQQTRAARSSLTAMPGGGMTSSLAPLTIPALATMAGTAVRLGSTAVRSAATWCARNPKRCALIGGLTAADAYLSQTGRLPPGDRRRSRGITARELRGFRRVARILHKYTAPVRSAMRSPALRRSKR